MYAKFVHSVENILTSTHTNKQTNKQTKTLFLLWQFYSINKYILSKTPSNGEYTCRICFTYIYIYI